MNGVRIFDPFGLRILNIILVLVLPDTGSRRSAREWNTQETSIPDSGHFALPHV